VLPDLIDVAVVGGGAAGLATAIFAARGTVGRSIVILDGARRLGAKILVAGGGRCNVTNRAVSAADYCGGSPHSIARVLAAFPVARTVAFFQELGVELHEEEGGKLFPTTNKARTVLDALLAEARRCGVRILTEQRVAAVERHDDGFRVVTATLTLHARRVVLATGGCALPKTGSDGAGYALAERLGHALVPPTPALVPLVLAGDFHRSLSGIAQDVELTVRAAGAKAVRVRGALLWAHFGVSGPAVLDASRHWLRARLAGQAVDLTVSFLPGADLAGAEQRLLELAAAHPKAQVCSALARLVPARVGGALLHELELDGALPLAHFPKPQRRRLVQALLAWPLAVRDSRSYQHAEVTAGGVPLNEVDPGSMASRKCPGLHLVGEILDVDGRIGGFNFQWAWASAWVAGSFLGRPASPESG
jgi:predicted Rossmann fold flavoprotein